MQKEKKLRSLEESKFLVLILKWLSICDIVFEFINCWQFLTLASSTYFAVLNENYSPFLCALKGIIQQFFEVGTLNWSFILATTLFRIMYFDVPLIKITKSMKYYHIYVWYVI